MASKNQSFVWNAFERVDKNKVLCLCCKEQLKYCNGTSGMHKHLISRHPTHYDELKTEAAAKEKEVQPKKRTLPKLAQPTIGETLQKRTKYEASSERKQNLDRLLIEMIVLDMQTFSVVEDRGFVRFINALDPRYQPPSRRTLTRATLPALYEKERKRISDELKIANHIALTTDLWSSRRTEGFITVTAHFVNPEWELKTVVLVTWKTDTAHTAENIAEELKKVMEVWSIREKVFAIVTDNASTMVKAIDLLQIRRVPCFAHILNLLVKDTLNATEGFVTMKQQVKNIITFFHQSIKGSDKLREVQLQSRPSVLKLIQEVDTRWNSTLNMFERYIELHPFVTTALCLLGKAAMIVTDADVSIMRQVCQTLKPFELATVEMSGEKYTTISKTIPIIRSLQDLTKSTADTTNCPVANEMLRQIRKRFPHPEEALLWAASTFLDPRFKKHAFTDQTALKQIQDRIVGQMKQSETETPSTSTEQIDESTLQSSATTSLWVKFDSKIKTFLHTTSQSSVKPNTEIRRFNEEDPISRAENPLTWWKNNANYLPQLSTLAMKYLACPATSVSSERLFSKAGELISMRRSNIKDKNIDMVLFLNKNLLIK